MPNTKYNSASLFNPFQGMFTTPANGIVDVDNHLVFGTTAVTTTKWIARDETANAATPAYATATEAGRYGVITLTPHASGGLRFCQNKDNIYLSASNPYYMEAAVKFVTGGSYFVGFAELVANQSAVISAGALAATIQGCGIAIQTDDKMDLISLGTSGDTANTAVADIQTLTAGTWYRLGIKAWQGKLEGYVNGRKVSQQTMTTTITTAMTPTLVAASSGATKILTVDWIGVAY